MLMQLGEFGGDQVGHASLVLAGQPQHPVPEVVIDAGQGGSGDLPWGSMACDPVKIRSTFTGSARISM
jgi:hypothetical protein